MAPLRFSRLKTVHLIGIKGAGMTALAEVLLKNGATVTGSDTDEKFFTDDVLHLLGIRISEGFSPDNLPAAIDAVIHSTVYSKESNPELAAAYARHIPVFSYPEAIGQLTREKMTLAVCGTHGKTTTSALLAETLRQCGADPMAIVGSRIGEWGGNALVGKGRYFVLEADEYQNKLAHYEPFGVILTSADYDHPDFFPDPASYERVFVDFVKKIPVHGVLVYCADSATVARIASEARCRTISYGFFADAEYRIEEYAPQSPASVIDRGEIRQTFMVEHSGASLGTFSLRLAGKHNASNAVAVLALCDFLNQQPECVTRAFEAFAGTERRFEYVGERFGAFVYDDYAHHPEEIRATLAAFRELFPQKRITVVFHPHTFTRTQTLLTEFSQSFEEADRVFILDIYGSARETRGNVSSQDLVDRIDRYFPNKAEYAQDRDALIGRLEKEIGRNDVIITMGAGDVWRVARTLVRKKEGR